MQHIYRAYYYSAIKKWKFFLKKENFSFATVWMDLGDIMLIEVSQTEKDKYSMLLFTCGI